MGAYLRGLWGVEVGANLWGVGVEVGAYLWGVEVDALDHSYALDRT